MSVDEDGIWRQMREKVNEAAFATDKQRQLFNLQKEMRSLTREIERQFQKLGEQAFALYTQKELNTPQLNNLCIAISDLRQQQQTRLAEINRVREQTYQIVCPVCDRTLPGDTAVCPDCAFDLHRFNIR